MSTHDRARLRLIIGALMLVVLLATLDATIVGTALPTIVGELGGISELSWVVTAYLLAATVTGPLYGKLGDLYGRKVLLQSAIVVFLTGSALCGTAQNMVELIGFRALQGVGAGGLIVNAIAVVADIVPPRDRGRFEAPFGAVFAASGLAGPLVGGFFVDQLSWRWIFYVNIPVGTLTFLLIGTALHPRAARVRHRVDYLGALLLTTGLASVILVTSIGGHGLPWASAPIAALATGGVCLLACFALVERRASEPIIPPDLIRNRIYAVAASIGFILGVTMFATVTYLPLFLQVVQGRTPTGSGLQLAPMLAGSIVSSFSTGQLVSRTGRYRPFPIVGMAVLTIGLALVTQLGQHSGTLRTSLSVFVLGLGTGLVMQVLVVAVQNSVDVRRMGVASSGTVLFRQMGACIGTAAFGAVFASRFRDALRGVHTAHTVSPAFVQQLPAGLHTKYVAAVETSLHPVFVAAVVVAAVGFVLAWFLRELPLRETSAALLREPAAAHERQAEVALEPE